MGTTVTVYPTWSALPPNASNLVLRIRGTGQGGGGRSAWRRVSTSSPAVLVQRFLRMPTTTTTVPSNRVLESPACWRELCQRRPGGASDSAERLPPRWPSAGIIAGSPTRLYEFEAKAFSHPQAQERRRVSSYWSMGRDQAAGHLPALRLARPDSKAVQSSKAVEMVRIVGGGHIKVTHSSSWPNRTFAHRTCNPAPSAKPASSVVDQLARSSAAPVSGT